MSFMVSTGFDYAPPLIFPNFRIILPYWHLLIELRYDKRGLRRPSNRPRRVRADSVSYPMKYGVSTLRPDC